MRKAIALALIVFLLVVTTSASAIKWLKEDPVPNGTETESIFEMLDAVYNGAVASALVSGKGEERYVFILGADSRSMYIFDPSNPGLQHLEFWETEELDFQMFYVYYPDMLLDKIAMD